MKPRRAAKRDSRPRLIVACVVALFIAFAGVGLFRLVVTTTSVPIPEPPATATPDLRWYRSLPVAACPTSLDPELRRQFYREGQCPQGGRKR